jgi:hypothetical protein
MQSYGPNLSETYTYNAGVLKFIDQCTKYVSSLSDFDKFCVWRYTIGSASVNSYLIFGKLSENSVRWTYLFFLYYKNTFGIKYLHEPAAYAQYSLKKQQEIAEFLIQTYILKLQSIIVQAPKVSIPFHVFKVAGKYPGLDIGNVSQLPFNSTTISPYFNFAPFISPESDCCFFDILLPTGATCLFVPQEYHAYPFEMEILLPHSCIFKVEDIRSSKLNYIDPKTVKMEQVQNKNRIRFGPVYSINEYKPCGIMNCKIQTKKFNVYDTVYVNP